MNDKPLKTHDELIEYLKLIKEIYRLFSTIRPKLFVINEEDILKEMGFPSEWRNQLGSLVK